MEARHEQNVASPERLPQFFSPVLAGARRGKPPDVVGQGRRLVRGLSGRRHHLPARGGGDRSQRHRACPALILASRRIETGPEQRLYADDQRRRRRVADTSGRPSSIQAAKRLCASARPAPPPGSSSTSGRPATSWRRGSNHASPDRGYRRFHLTAEQRRQLDRLPGARARAPSLSAPPRQRSANPRGAKRVGAVALHFAAGNARMDRPARESRYADRLVLADPDPSGRRSRHGRGGAPARFVLGQARHFL